MHFSSTVLNDALPPALPRLANTLAAAVPDASDWSIDNVVEFFTEVGFTEQAQQFKEQVCCVRCGEMYVSVHMKSVCKHCVSR